MGSTRTASRYISIREERGWGTDLAADIDVAVRELAGSDDVISVSTSPITRPVQIGIEYPVMTVAVVVSVVCRTDAT